MKIQDINCNAGDNLQGLHNELNKCRGTDIVEGQNSRNGKTQVKQQYFTSVVDI